MSGNGKSLGLKSYDDIFSTEEERQETRQERVVRLPLADLHYFKNHPFKVKDDEQMAETAESVKDYGVLVPGLVRPDPAGGYEIVSGHRRHRASELAGVPDMPVIIREMDDDTAVVIMVDSNLQRENLLPSEKAWAYKMKLDAMNRQGERNDLTCSQLGNKLKGIKSSDLLATQSGESKNQIFRYIRLTSLTPPILDVVDEKKLAFNPAVEVSYLKPEEQGWLFEAMCRDECSPSLGQAQRLKKFSQDGKLTEDVISAILSEERPLETKLVFDKRDNLSNYFPKSFTARQQKEVIFKLLDTWAKNRQRQQGQER